MTRSPAFIQVHPRSWSRYGLIDPLWSTIGRMNVLDITPMIELHIVFRLVSQALALEKILPRGAWNLVPKLPRSQDACSDVSS